MADQKHTGVEPFSMEKHLADWTQRQESVSVEGTLQEDGDYYVIDRDPRNPCSVLRVRKADVTATEKSRTEHAAGGDRQLYHVSIKRGAPVQVITVSLSDSLSSSSCKCGCNKQKPMGALSRSQVSEPLFKTTSQLGSLVHPFYQGPRRTICWNDTKHSSEAIIGALHSDGCTGQNAGQHINALLVEDLSGYPSGSRVDVCNTSNNCPLGWRILGLGQYYSDCSTFGSCMIIQKQ